MSDQPAQPVNPLDDLAQFDQRTDLPSLPSPPRAHTSGRRELRAALLSRGVPLIVRPASQSDRMKMLRGERVDSLPIKRTEEKRGGLTKKEWKAARQLAREAADKAAKENLNV
jgi:hypothetical protein